jgi:flagellar P-ring protein FlgI
MLRFIVVLTFVCAHAASVLAESRIKDIADIYGVRGNPLVGYGLVIGLNGTGDTLRSSPFTSQSLQSMLETMGVNIQNAQARTKNIASVMVTAELPSMGRSGNRLDVAVSSLGDATSLQGGTLVMTHLLGGDGQVYALAQGSIAVSGFSARGKAETLTQGVPTSGRVPGGAIIERDAPGSLADLDTLVLEVRNPDYATVSRVTHAINRFTQELFKTSLAQERDMRTVVIKRPEKMPASRFIGAIGELRVETDAPARVVIDEKTGTVVIGRHVQISAVAVSQGSLTVRVMENDEVSQPNPFSEGETVVLPRTTIEAKREQGKLAVVSGVSLEKLVQGLNALGLKPGDLIAILQAIKSAGALQADLVIQ